ncbi:MAG: cell division protein FtsB [Methylophilaceae bacterium]
MKILTFVLFVLLLLIQYPLWWGKGSFYKVYRLNQNLDKQYQINLELRRKNNALKAEVNDLKRGTDVIEERARDELGMVKKDEVFFQIINKQKQ